MPARNTVFLSLALAWAETLGARDIVIGVNALDYSGYPDCRPDFIAAFEHDGVAGDAGRRRGARFRIHAPLIDWSKAEIIRRGLELGLDYGLTHSCYDPWPAARRAAAATVACFARAGSPRPACPTRLLMPADGTSADRCAEDDRRDRTPLLHRPGLPRVRRHRRVLRDAWTAGLVAVLDRTAFYPTSGGQPFDTGTLGGGP